MNNLKLITPERFGEFVKEANGKFKLPTDQTISDFPRSYVLAAYNDGIQDGKKFAEGETAAIMQHLIIWLGDGGNVKTISNAQLDAEGIELKTKETCADAILTIFLTERTNG